MRERFLPVPTGQTIEAINPLTTKEMVDVVASAICRCPSCAKQAEPVLSKNPLLRGMDRKKAQGMWAELKREARNGKRS